MKGNSEYIEVDGEVISALPNAMFRVRLSEGREIICHISGRIRKNFVNILPSDEVLVAVSKYDLTKGRIIYRKRV